MALVGNEIVKVTGITPTGGPSGQEEQCTTADIANLTPGSSGANPSATAGPTAVNGSAVTFLRSDGAPAIQLGTNAQKGIVQVDGTTLVASSGVISVSNTGSVPVGSITLPNGKIPKGNGSNVAAAVDDVATILIPVDGAGSAITTGIKKPYIFVDFGCTITAATLLADQSGSISMDVIACSYANFDAGSTHPVSGDKIDASAPPTITTATKSQDTTLTGWATTVAAGTVLTVNVLSATTIQKVTLALKVVKT